MLCDSLNLTKNEVGEWICSNSSLIKGCSISDEHGCIKCQDKYYLNDGICLTCDNSCLNCYESSSNCTSCRFGYKLNETTGKCISVGNELIQSCQKFFPDYSGCAICKDGYYYEKKDCIKCDESCKTCISTQCIICKDDYFIDYKQTIFTCSPR